MIKERNVSVPMRDGVHLAADVWRPDTDRPVPVLVSRTPYGRDMVALMSEPEVLAHAGFAVVLQDCRGRFGSEGEWGYVSCEVDDGYDTVEWAAAQPWSNGRVGMFGASYMGHTQWLAAVAGPPHLEVMAPECCAADHWVASFHLGGTFRLASRIGWTASVIAAMAPEWGIEDPLLDKLRQVFLDSRAAAAERDPAAIRAGVEATKPLLEEVYRTRPLAGNELWHGKASWLNELFEHEPRDDAHWLAINPSSHYEDLDLPAVHVGGWYDIHLEGILRNYTGMRRQAPTERARQAQRLVIGPWSHWSPMVPVVGDIDFGPDAVLNTTELRVAWFRHWLAGDEDPGWAPVRIFVMGTNAWRDEQEWPLARTEYTPWYLGAAGHLGPERPGQKNAERPGQKNAERPGQKNAERPGQKNAERPGQKSTESPAAQETKSTERPGTTTTERPGTTNAESSPAQGADNSDPFTYDPRHPVPTLGGRLLGIGEVPGPVDQRPAGERPDVLVYTSEPLPEPIELTGPVRMELWAATDAPDTDFTAVLVNVHPDGRAYNLCEGAVRARHSGTPVPLVPGAVYRFTIDLAATSIVLPAGHRLRLHVSSSCFPEWEPNPNTGRPIGVDTDADLRVARQQVFHDQLHPSHVVLPIIPG